MGVGWGLNIGNLSCVRTLKITGIDISFQSRTRLEFETIISVLLAVPHVTASINTREDNGYVFGYFA